MKKLLKSIALLTAMLLLLTSLAACSSGGETPAPTTTDDAKTDENASDTDGMIAIGGIGPLTGDVAMYGVSCMNGANLAVEEINAAGGVLGQKIDFIVNDDKGDPIEASNAYNKLKESGIVALIGAVTSKPSDAVAQLAAQDNLPMITPTGTAESITTHGENVFRAPFIDPYQGEVMARFAKEFVNAETVALVRNNSSDYSDGIATRFVETATSLGMTVVADESYGDTDVDFKSQLTKIQATNPDVLFIPDYYQKVSLIAPQARQVGIDAQLLGVDGWDGVIKSIKADDLPTVEGSYFCNTFALDDPDQKVQDFITKYKDTFGENPQSFSALGYDSVYLMAEAIKNAGSTDSAAINEALKNIDYSGVSGSFVFDENRNPKKSVFMTIIEGDQYKLAEKMEAQ